MIGLLPCPFCGGEAFLMEDKNSYVMAICKSPLCASSGGRWRKGLELKAIEKWNTRASQQAAAPHWQPIETAPLNKAILVFLPNQEHYGHAVYRAIHVDMGSGKRWHSCGWAMGRDIDPACWPTHWMPLPPPPDAIKTT